MRKFDWFAWISHSTLWNIVNSLRWFVYIYIYICSKEVSVLTKPVIVNIKPNEAETLCNYAKNDSILHDNRTKIEIVILSTKCYSQFNHRDNSFIKFRSKGTTDNARILTCSSCTSNNLTLVNIFQIENSLMNNFYDRSSMGQFPSSQILAKPNYIVYGTFSNLAVITINWTIAPVTVTTF